MKRLYNQTNKALDWSMGGKKFACSPFDHVDIPDELVEACKSRHLPLAVTPIPPEAKAKTTLAVEQDLARKDEVRLLKIELDDAKAREAIAKKTAENLQADLSDRDGKIVKLTKELDQTKDRLRIVESDKTAAESLLEETGRKLVHAEDWIAKNKVETLAAAETEPAKGEAKPPKGTKADPPKA